ncbi:MAG: hypothetical protein JWN98_2195 [Abditibacteriota bacterium]|nr:hypothetical protein [Abditibacteriota bacterium]
MPITTPAEAQAANDAATDDLSISPEETSTLPVETLERIPMTDVRVSMTRVVIAWGFGMAFMNLTSGAVYTAFAREIGASNTIMGILAAALPVMGFLQVWGAYLVERRRRRKQQMLIAGLLSRSLWVGAALSPLIAQAFPESIPKEWVLWIVVSTVLVSSVCQAFSSPAFFSWMADLVPSRVRSTFFARRMQMGTFVALFTSTAGGLVADFYPSLTIYCLILALAGVCGMLDILFFIGVREPRKVFSSPDVDQALDELARDLPSPMDSIREPMRDPSVRRFLMFVSLLMVGYALQGPFLWLHCLENLKMNKTVTGLILNGAPLLAMAITSRFWGDVTRRHGNRPVMRLASIGLMVIPLGWIFSTDESAILLGVLLFLSGILAGALDLSNMNLITGLAPHVPRSTMTAVFSIAAGTSFAVASVAGGRIADWLEHWEIHILGHTYLNYHVLFVLSMLVRVVNAVCIAPRLREPEATSTRGVVRDLFPQIVEGLSARITRPFGTRGD